MTHLDELFDGRVVNAIPSRERRSEIRCLLKKCAAEVAYMRQTKELADKYADECRDESAALRSKLVTCAVQVEDLCRDRDAIRKAMQMHQARALTFEVFLREAFSGNLRVVNGPGRPDTFLARGHYLADDGNGLPVLTPEAAQAMEEGSRA